MSAGLAFALGILTGWLTLFGGGLLAIQRIGAIGRRILKDNPAAGWLN